MSRLYIGRIPNSASRHDVERFLRGYGRVQEIVMMKNYAFVELNDSRDVEDAVHDLNGRNLAGSRVIVERTRLPPRFRRQRHHSPPRRPPPFKQQQRFRGPKFGPPQRTDYRIIVDNLSSRISWQDLKDIMRKVGDVTFAGAHMTKRNEGVVEFVNSSDMRRAIEKYNGYVLYGRKLRVFQDRERRSSSRSPSGSPPPSKKHHSHKRSRHSHKNRDSRSRSHSSRRSSPQDDSDKRRDSRSRTRSRSPVRRESKSPDSDKQSKHSRDASPSADVRDDVSDTKSNDRGGSVKSDRSINLSQSPRSHTANDEDQSDQGSHRSASP